MTDFSFEVPNTILFGSNSLEQLPNLLKKEGGHHVFLISDRGIEKTGMVDSVIKQLESNGFKYDTFLDVEANPSINTVKNAVARIKQIGADCLVALGGGSPMDTAKSVGVLEKYGGNLYDYVGGGKVPGPIMPLIAIPTTAGTGSEVTSFSVITDTEKNYKISVKDKNIIPCNAILDPKLLLQTPKSIAAASGMDAFIHAMESYISVRANPFSEAMSEKAMELIGRSIRAFVANRSNEIAASDMILGSSLAGIAFSSVGLGNIHAMSHPVSAHFHVPHGIANAILMPYIVSYNSLTDSDKYAKIYSFIMGISAPQSFCSSDLAVALKCLNRELGIPDTLSNVGVTESKIEQMAYDAMKSGNIYTNPRQSTLSDIIHLYHKAL